MDKELNEFSEEAKKQQNNSKRIQTAEWIQRRYKNQIREIRNKYKTWKGNLIKTENLQKNGNSGNKKSSLKPLQQTGTSRENFNTWRQNKYNRKTDAYIEKWIKKYE
jgi:inorganic pyrophosphatase